MAAFITATISFKNYLKTKNKVFKVLLRRKFQQCFRNYVNKVTNISRYFMGILIYLSLIGQGSNYAKKERMNAI